MISTTDLIRLSYTPDLTEGGIAHAMRSLAFLNERAGARLADRLRRNVATIAVELAFRRLLSQENIPFDVRISASFSERERFDVFLKDRRCGLKSFFISDRKQVLQVRADPAALLDAPALVPADAHAADGHAYNDLYVFAFVTGLTAASQPDLKKAAAKNLPHYLMHVMPKAWRQPVHWTPLGELTLKSESSEELILEVTGQDSGREVKRVTVSLPPRVKIKLDEGFHSISALHVRRIPEARVGIHSSQFAQAHLVAPLDWDNLWVYGTDIFFAGYLSFEEFGQRAKMILPDSRVFQYSHTRSKNLAVPVAELKSMRRLLDSIK